MAGHSVCEASRRGTALEGPARPGTLERHKAHSRRCPVRPRRWAVLSITWTTRPSTSRSAAKTRFTSTCGPPERPGASGRSSSGFTAGATIRASRPPPPTTEPTSPPRTMMVFVSLNYRLGKLGWFSAPALRTGDPLDDSGNYGTLDMIKALTWVKNNIAAFGGDPNKRHHNGSVGWSDGHQLRCCVTPLAKGLFQRAMAHERHSDEHSPQGCGRCLQRHIIRGSSSRTDMPSNDQEAAQFMADKGNAWVASYLRSKPAEEFLQPTIFNAGLHES